MSHNRAFAYWANLYNAITLQVVLANYPVRSIRDIRSRGAGLDLRGLIGPWRTKRVTIEGAQAVARRHRITGFCGPSCAIRACTMR